ncbi:MAG TPA: hypothetical protein VGP73_03330 [Thermoanaerobaculia bacterium]
MPYIRRATLIRRSVTKAFQTPLNLLAGAAGLGAAWYLHDPTWALVWGTGAAGWVALATVKQRYKPRIEEEVRRRREAKEEKERAALRQKIQWLLDETPFDLWVHAGYLPDYMAVFHRLTEIRNRVSRVLAERHDLDAFTKEDILQQLGTMLNAYLGFVRERISYLHILASVRPQEQAPPPSNALPGWRKDWRRLSARIAPVFVPPLPSLEKRLSDVDDKIRQIRDLATREPATTRTRQFHIGILEKQRELLLDCHKRDQCVVAQLGAFSDAFEVIHGRLSASQFNAVEVAAYMSHLVEQIVETEKFVETLRPSVDGLMGGLDPAMAGTGPGRVPGVGAVRQGGVG